MKYVILIHHNPASQQIWERFSESERAEGLRRYAELTQDLVASGELIAAEALADASVAKRVTSRDGAAIATDGPFAETKEQLAGLYIVDCDSYERAVEIAGRIPEAAFGLIEVRPTMNYVATDALGTVEV